MLISKLTLFTLALLFPFTAAAMASDIDVKAGNVRVNTSVAGDIYIQSGPARVNVESSSSEVLLNARRYETNRYCSQRSRYRCHRLPTQVELPNVHSPKTQTTTIILEAPITNQSGKVRSTQRISCSGNGSYSRQQVHQRTSSSGTVIVESKVTTNTCP